MEIYETVIKNIERLRKNYGLKYSEIDKLGNLKKGTYLKVIEHQEILDIKDLIAIAEIYSLKAEKVFNPKMRMPPFLSLPVSIQEIATERLGKTAKRINKRDLVQYCILILNEYYKPGDEFTNSDIKSHLKGELETIFKDKSIEWHKSILSLYVNDTGNRKSGKTKPEKIYKLVKKVPAEMVNKAKETVGMD